MAVLGRRVDFSNLLPHGQRQECGFPHAAAFVPLWIADLLLAIVFAHEAVLHVDHHFLAHTVGVVEAVAVHRDGEACGAIGDVDGLVDVARHVVGGDPAVDHFVFLHGVDVVVGILPVFGFKICNGDVGRVSGLWHHHWRGVKVVVTAGECYPEKQNAQIYIKSFHNVC